MLGDIDRAAIRLDQAEAVFARLPTLPDADVLARLVGTYETPLGRKIGVKLSRDNDIALFHPGEPADVLKPFKGLQFRSSDFPDITFEFVLEEDGRAKALRHWNAHDRQRSRRRRRPCATLTCNPTAPRTIFRSAPGFNKQKENL